jgi:hypothetical protein
MEEKPIRWAEYPFLQGSAFHLLAGIKNAGKGTWLAHLAARVTTGQLPVGRRVIWIALGEDSYAIDVRPRIRVAGGDVNLVTVPTVESDIVLPMHLDALRHEMGNPGDVGLVVIDPLGGALESGRSSNSDTDVRPMLRALNALADEYGSMVFGVRHISIKADARKNGALSGILGSSDWINVPRMVLALLHDDIEPSDRHLFVLTGNRGPEYMPGMMLRIEAIIPTGHEYPIGRMVPLGPSYKDPDELLSTKRQRRDSRSADAEKLILDMLSERGPMESSILDALIVEQTGLAAQTVRNIRANSLGGKGQGLIRMSPEQDPGNAQINRWWVTLTDAGRARYLIPDTYSPGTQYAVSGDDRIPPAGTPDTTDTESTSTYSTYPLSLPLEMDDDERLP